MLRPNPLLAPDMAAGTIFVAVIAVATMVTRVVPTSPLTIRLAMNGIRQMAKE